MGIANTTAGGRADRRVHRCRPAEATGRGTGIDDPTHARKMAVVAAALALHRPDPADPIGVLAAVGGLEHAALAGFILGAAARAGAGAARRRDRGLGRARRGRARPGRGRRDGRRAPLGRAGRHGRAARTWGCDPLIDLGLRLGEGTGALLALPVVASAVRVLHEVATFDSAGVSEK